MKPENAIRCFDLDRFDEVGMRNRDRMQDTFERFLPKPQKGPQPMEIRVEVVVLPDVSFAAARDGQGAGTGYSPWLGRTFYLLLKILRGHEKLQVIDGQVFHRGWAMTTPEDKYCS